MHVQGRVDVPEGEGMRYTAAAIQFDCVPGDRNYNLARAFMMLRKVAKGGASLIVLPENFSTGTPPAKQLKEHAEEFKGDLFERMKGIAEETSTTIAYSFIESAGKELYSTAVLMGPKGPDGYHRREYLTPEEEGTLTGGIESQVYDTPLGKMALLLGHEIEYPEAGRAIAKADVVCLCAAARDEELWEIATRARAIENGFWLVAANRSGMDGIVSYCGSTRIVSPTGVVVHKVLTGEDTALYEIKTGDVSWARERRPYQRGLELAERRSRT